MVPDVTGATLRKVIVEHLRSLQQAVWRRLVESGQYTSWTFSQRVRAAKLAHSLGSGWRRLDNAVVESFWARMETESLDTRWRTRTELSTEIFDGIEVLYNRTRRRSALGMLAPIAYEKLHSDDTHCRLIPARRVHGWGDRPGRPINGVVRSVALPTSFEKRRDVRSDGAVTCGAFRMTLSLAGMRGEGYKRIRRPVSHDSMAAYASRRARWPAQAGTGGGCPARKASSITPR
ncbi:MAG TPA: integrase core domain-containing protein [Acidimicrobiales bacterium]|nr:integrase core domain-containing protein [Acidimicrobiales bacterium]